jgi:hypothetical protein
MFSITPSLNDWRLSIQVSNFLRQDLKLLSYLEQERCKPQFSIGYLPQHIEVFYDHELCIQVDKNEIFMIQSISKGHMPQVIEIFFDRELAMFLIDSEIIVDRTLPNQTINRILHNCSVKSILE